MMRFEMHDMRHGMYLLAIAFCLFQSATDTHAIVFKKPDEALRGIFRNAVIEVKNIVLTPEQVNEVERLSGVKQSERLVSFYEAKRGSEVAGYGFIDSHIVRTKPETVLYIIRPDGEIDAIEVLAFGEPLEYLPHGNWLKLFKGRSIDKDLIRFRRDISSISGATMTAKAITDSTRKALALWKVLYGGRR